jgi:hypothetical protein
MDIKMAVPESTGWELLSRSTIIDCDTLDEQGTYTRLPQ